ncbi:MAG TPA: protein kinase, partial [Vicinamibacteria bacterium]|nr:protein kinase [Vicinamibacteria bacterium]
KKGPLRLDEALEYGIQIADALDKAHRAGIVHRDLKPGNVMLTRSGVKLLDFGLARLVASEPRSDSSDVPTRQKDLTGERAILGTLPYMSPEQLEGKSADPRMDVWAFGAVLYEMVVGSRAFDGTSQASLIAAIMRGLDDRPAPTRAIEPPLLNEVIRRCLSVDTERRWASAADIAHVLSWLRSSMRDPAQPVAGSRKRPTWLSATIVSAAFLAGWVASLFFRPTPSPTAPREPRIELSIPLGAEEDFARAPSLAVSSDGRLLVYEGVREGVSQLFRRSLDISEVVALPGTENGSAPFLSPDGKSLAFFSSGSLKKVSLDGGPVVTLASGRVGGGGSWAADGRIVYVENRNELRMVSASGGPSTSVKMDVAEETSVADPLLLDDGKNILFTQGSSGQEQVAVGSMATGEVRVLTSGRRPRLSADDHLLFVRDAAVWAVGFDSERLELRGAPIPIVNGVLDVFSATFDVSFSGAIFFVPEESERALVWVDREGRSTLLTTTRDRYGSPRLSPDGTRVAVETHLKDIWVFDVERGSRARLTVESATGMNTVPAWTHDGKMVTFFRLHEGVSAICTAPADGSQPPEPILLRDNWPIPGSWSPDGRTLAFHDLPAGGNRDILVFIPGSGEPPQPILATAFNERSPAFSPDGRWLAYVSDESGRDEVYVRAYPGLGTKTAISTEGGVQPVWSPLGNELFYRHREAMMVVAIETAGELRSSKPRLLFRGRYDLGNPHNPSYGVSPDGKKFVMVQEAEEGVRRFGVILNWNVSN